MRLAFKPNGDLRQVVFHQCNACPQKIMVSNHMLSALYDKNTHHLKNMSTGQSPYIIAPLRELM